MRQGSKAHARLTFWTGDESAAERTITALPVHQTRLPERLLTSLIQPGSDARTAPRHRSGRCSGTRDIQTEATGP